MKNIVIALLIGASKAATTKGYCIPPGEVGAV
jgi:hypothetical protein